MGKKLCCLLNLGILLCFVFAGHSAAGDKMVDYHLDVKADDFYVFKGEFDASFFAKGKTAQGAFDRELGFMGGDFTVRDSKESCLLAPSPAHSAVMSIFRIKNKEYKIGKKYAAGLKWKDLVVLKNDFKFTGPAARDGRQYQLIVARIIIMKHPAIISAVTVDLQAYYSSHTSLIEHIDMEITGAVKTRPVWFCRVPEFEARGFKYTAKAKTILIHLNAENGMPFCYSDDAVKSGVDFLLAKQNKNGSWTNTHSVTAVCLVALLKSGVLPEHPAMQLGFRYLLENYRTGDKADHYTPNIYTSGLLCLYVQANLEWLKENLSEDDLNKVRQMLLHCTGELEKAFAAHKNGWGDLSRTQYAVMGLFAGATTGWYKPDKNIATGIMDMHLNLQQSSGPQVKIINRKRKPDEDHGKAGDNSSVVRKNSSYIDSEDFGYARGWPYRKGDTPTGSMSYGAVASICFGRELLVLSGQLNDSYKQRIAKALRDGCAWLQSNFSVTENPGHPKPERHLIYYLYAMERACTMADWEFIEDRDWYREGCIKLMGRQKNDGRWVEINESTPVECATSLALLFFKRGSLALRKAAVSGR
ncbi:hypothetical protein ACFL54_00605 [Planctomycetota bacterium]